MSDESRLVAEQPRDRGAKTIIVCSSAMHLPRATEHYRGLGFAVTPLPPDFATRGEAAEWAWALLIQRGGGVGADGWGGEGVDGAGGGTLMRKHTTQWPSARRTSSTTRSTCPSVMLDPEGKQTPSRKSASETEPPEWGK